MGGKGRDERREERGEGIGRGTAKLSMPAKPSKRSIIRENVSFSTRSTLVSRTSANLLNFLEERTRESASSNN